MMRICNVWLCYNQASAAASVYCNPPPGDMQPGTYYHAPEVRIYCVLRITSCVCGLWNT